MNATAVVLGYLWLSLVLFCVLTVLVLLAVSTVTDVRARRRTPRNVIVLAERRDPSNLVRVIHGGGESA